MDGLLESDLVEDEAEAREESKDYDETVHYKVKDEISCVELFSYQK